MEPVSHYILLEHIAEARDHDTGHERMARARAPLQCNVIHATSDEAPGLLAYVAQHLGAHHSPALCHVQQALPKASAAPMAATQRAAHKAVTQAEETRNRVQEHLDTTNGQPAQRGPGRPPKAAVSLEQGTQDVAAARQEHQRLAGPRETVTQSLRALGHAYHFVDVERGVRRHGKRSARDIQRQLDTIRTIAQPEGLREACLARMAKAERGVPTRQATIACVSGYGRQQVRQWDLAPPASSALHAHRMPSYYLERVAATQTRTAGEPRHALAECLRTPRLKPDGVFGTWNPLEPEQLQHKATTLAEVFQRSSANVEGRNGSRSLRHHQLRGLDHPRKRACLTAMHNFFLTRPDGTTAAERFFGQKPRSMFATVLESVEIPPAPLSPPQRAVG
jgi:hypothetical protein